MSKKVGNLVIVSVVISPELPMEKVKYIHETPRMSDKPFLTIEIMGKQIVQKEKYNH